MTDERPSASRAADWALSRGIRAMTTAQVATLLNIPSAQVPQRLAQPRHRWEWIAPARGLWIPVPTQFRSQHGPPATEYLPELMAYLNMDHYYLGWLSAAAAYGATHHAPQQTQVAVSHTVRPREVGRARMTFHQHRHLEVLPTTQRMAASGPYLISTPEVTVLDLACDLSLAAGLSNAATVITDLSSEVGCDDATLTSLAPLFPLTAVKRVGWIIENLADTSISLPRLAAWTAQHSGRTSVLHPRMPTRGPYDRRWRLRLNAEVEVE